MVVALMMPAKLAPLGLLKIKVFQNKGYGIIISIRDITYKNLSHDSNYIVDVAMRQKFSNSRNSMREVISEPQC